LRPSRFRI